ncbi:MAG: hypothetical protein ACK5MN_03605 [Lachnospiraceae bacterium]
MPFGSLRYTKCAVIVHGKSELDLVKYIYTNLHLPVKIISRDRGKTSIQINGLLDFMQKGKFASLKSFAEEYTIEYDRKRKCLKNFKLFIIMDTDDCSESTRAKYISGELFRGHILEKYIVPIYNISNLEDVMIKARIMVRRIPDKEKGKYYSKIFPINTEPVSLDTKKQVITFANKIKHVRQTNLSEFISYCLLQLEAYDDKREKR